MKSISIALPPEVEAYEHDIRRFVDAMIYKLKVHSGKGRWEDATSDNMVKLLELEVAELKEALEGGNLIEILTEAADVANFGMIIASIAVERGK